MLPSTDGGYLAIGLRRPAPFLFEHMPWSTPQVGALTVQRLTHAGLSLHTFAAHHDIDEPADLVIKALGFEPEDLPKLPVGWLPG